jgi:hypothetical protein
MRGSASYAYCAHPRGNHTPQKHTETLECNDGRHGTARTELTRETSELWIAPIRPAVGPWPIHPGFDVKLALVNGSLSSLTSISIPCDVSPYGADRHQLPKNGVVVTDRRYGFGERGACAAISTFHLPCDSPTYQKPIESAMPVAQKRIIAHLGVDLLLPQVQIE